jgi:hypothetical protein
LGHIEGFSDLPNTLINRHGMSLVQKISLNNIFSFRVRPDNNLSLW